MNIFRLKLDTICPWEPSAPAMYRILVRPPWPFCGPPCYTRRYAIWAWFKYLLAHWLYLATFKHFRWEPRVLDKSCNTSSHKKNTTS
jgi:hypothetical protein